MMGGAPSLWPANVPPSTRVRRVCCVCQTVIERIEWTGASTLLPDPAFGVVSVAPGVTECDTHTYCEPCLADHERRVAEYERAEWARGEHRTGGARWPDAMGDGQDEEMIGGRW